MRTIFSALSFLAFVSVLLVLSTEADARPHRKPALELLSPNYQKKLVANSLSYEKELAALKGWSQQVSDWLALPRSKRPNETDLDNMFIRDVFEEALGYQGRKSGKDEWTVQSENRTDVDATRPDGILGFLRDGDDRSVRVVIEFKGLGADLDERQNRKHGKRTPVDQAFSYAHKFDDVRWVIVSNYQELRLYHKSSSKYAITFNLETIRHNPERARLLVHLLSFDNLISRDDESKTDRLYTSRARQLQQISDDFYHHYRTTRLQTVIAILKNNPGVDSQDAVMMAQTILDRMIFSIFLEGTNLIKRGLVEGALAPDVYLDNAIWDRVKGFFRKLDQGDPPNSLPAYNGGLFRANPTIQDLDIPDHLWKGYSELLKFDFESDLRVNILGQLFERSISDIETLKKQVQTEILGQKFAGSFEDIQNRLEQGKAGFGDDSRRHDEGAYYTPEEVTTYVVKNTLDPWFLETRERLGFASLPELEDGDTLVLLAKVTKANQAARERVNQHVEYWNRYGEALRSLRIVDPSCGSGAFLVAAFDALAEEGNRINQALANLNAPMTAARWDRDILRDVLYGVDISRESAEITRLSLWLKIAKNKEKLVALDDAIKVGNAVVADPAYDQAFDWQTEFPEVMQNGGFDIVIGNPPYVRHELIKDWKPALEQRFKTYAGTADLYVYFFELGYDLLKPGGRLGYIASNKWLRTGYGKTLRQFFRKHVTMTHVLDKGQTNIFRDAIAYPAIVVFQKQATSDPVEITITDPPFDPVPAQLSTENLDDEAWLLHEPKFFRIKEKMERAGTPLKDWDIEINRGITTGLNEAFIIDDEKRDDLIRQDPKSADVIKPLLRGRDIEKWHVEWPRTWLIFARRGIDIARYPAIEAHLEQYREQLTPKNKGESKGRKPGDYQWCEIQDTTAYHQAFEQPKIIYPAIKNETAFVVDQGGFYQNSKGFHIVSASESLPYLSAVLNSRLIFWYLRNHVSLLLGKTMELKEIYIRELPIPKLDTQARKPFEAWSQALTRAHADIQEKAGLFLTLLADEQSLGNPSNKLKHWYNLDWQDFTKELSTKKVCFHAGKKEEWHQRFGRYSEEVKELQYTIDRLQSELDTAVEQIYYLTNEEEFFIKNQ